MNDNQLLRYSRHILLDEIGPDGQAKFGAAHVLVVGGGGLGSPVALYLAAAGVGRLTLCDGDNVDLTNLQRQVLFARRTSASPRRCGGAKARRDKSGSPVEAIRARRDGGSSPRSSPRADVVLDCCDNFATRHAVNRACVAARVPLVSGAAIRFDGQVAVFDPRLAESPCYHCLFPEGEEVEEVRCATMGVFAPLTGIVGTMQAAEALKLVAGVGTPIAGRCCCWMR